MERKRPNPDELLSRLAENETRQSLGSLKVFFGAAPGVGKTYAMLEAARAKQRSGTGVLAGYVETHGRSETDTLLEGMEVLPRRKVEHRGRTLEDFDLDAALARKPDLVLVDELAHTNAPGARHAKRWQDVLELLQAGIDVYTTVNVQHLDSLNDVVAQITGIVVRETIPDSVLDRADEIELVDLPVAELLQRLEEGKVYVPEQAQRAVQNFFRPGNLIALRELALRRTADRVDAQMRDYRRDQRIDSTWPAAERLMVCIGPSPFSAKLIRATRRMATRLNAEWIAAFVEPPDYTDLPGDVRERILSSLRLAEQLGGETATLSGTRASEALLRYARSRNVSRIVVGKPGEPLWKRWLRGSLVDELIERSGDIEIYAISGQPDSAAAPRASLRRPAPPWGEYAEAAAIVAACTLVSLPLRPHLAPTNLVMVYLLGLVGVAMRCSRRVAVFASFLSVAAFDFFCVPPYLTFAVSDYEYLITFAVMLLVGLVISTQTARVRMQAAAAVDRVARTQALYRLSRRLAAETRVFEAARSAARLAEEVFSGKVILFLPEEDGRITFRRRTSETLLIPAGEESIAQWVFDHQQKAGRGMDTLPGATALYLPLLGAKGALGVMAVVAEAQAQVFSPEQQHLLEVFADQTAAAMERILSVQAAQDAQVRAREEQMRSSLLSAVSHDLRTPLASITGAASTLLSQGDRIAPETGRDLLESISEEAERLGRLVSNLLDMTRLESGGVELRKDWYPIEEIVGAALQRVDRRLKDHVVTTDLPERLPLIRVDDVLIGQVFVNLLENAAKYTPAGTPIEIVAAGDEAALRVEVRDRGPGFSPEEERHLFEKFYRGKPGGVRGAGLGLAICRAIVEAHQGVIVAENRVGGGAVFRIRIPIGGRPPSAPAREEAA